MSVSISPLTEIYPARNPDGRNFTADDLWQLARPGRPVPSPGGDHIVSAVTTFDVEKNNGTSRLWKLALDGKSARPITGPDQSATEPVFSPDGGKLAFLRKKEPKEKAQLYIMPTDGGEPERVTEMPLGVADPRWLPDGKSIAFVSALISGALTIEATRARIEERDKNPVKARVTEDRVYRFWDTWLTGGEAPHIFVLDLESRKLTDLIPDSTRWFDFMEPAGSYDISPDGREIVFSANTSQSPHSELRWGLFTVPTAGGKTTELTPQNPADDLKPRYSPDGSHIVYGKRQDPFFYADRVRLIRRDRRSGAEEELLSGWDRSPSNWIFSRTGSLILEVEEFARHKIFVIDAGTGEPRLLSGEGTASRVTVDDEGTVYLVHETLSSPPEIARIPLAGGELTYLSRFNRRFCDEVALGQAMEMEFAGADGKTVQAFVVTPPGFDPAKKWPLVHLIHGGPHGTSGEGFHFRWNTHLFASPGYVTVMVNFHGSTSWGQEFAQCIQGAHADKPYTDIMKATDAMIATGFIDEKRMAVTGGSYGGYMVTWIAGHTDRFRCIVNHAGVFNILSQYASDVTQGRHQAYGGEPWDDIAPIDRWNPSRYTGGFVTPMLVIHGERDYRVPVTQGLEVYGILKAKGVDARLVYFPDENHWILKPRNSIFWHREVSDWLERYLT